LKAGAEKTDLGDWHLALQVRLKPDYANSHYNLGRVLAMSGRTGEAIAHLTNALRLNPNFPEAREFLDYVNSSR